ncbi:MAG: RlmE family RNA methyltransferase [Spirochaetales bacterium]|nr:RlmE family RNA methyltransferase [Spirochaetales bacterium]
MAGKNRSEADFYTLKAKKEGYPARSVYKLEEILQKTHALRSGCSVLDIGAAPGSWSLYLQRKLKARLVAVDLQPLKIPSGGQLVFFQGDFFSADTGEKLKPYAPFDAVISDAAPSTTGNRTVDAGRSYELVAGVIDACSKYLRAKGVLIVKVFQGGDEQELLVMMKERFSQVKALKPKACRKESFETYFIGTGYTKSGQ